MLPFFKMQLNVMLSALGNRALWGQVFPLSSDKNTLLSS